MTYTGSKPWPELTSGGATFSPPPETFMLAYRGSIAHGMFIPSDDPKSIDDIDLMGFVFGAEKMLIDILQDRFLCLGDGRMD